MKCTEVIEWMHRYLDHDLNREEITEMFQHIDHCLSCAEIFDRLSTLSHQLEQLPDVKAPFSLVDSILPQLEALDRSLLESGKGNSADPVVVPFSRESSKGKRSKSSSMGRRTGFGAIAAAIILGIAIFNMPKEMPGAQVDDLIMNDNAKTMDVGSNAASKMNADTAESADTANAGNAPDKPANDSSFLAAIAESPSPSADAQDAADPTNGGPVSDVSATEAPTSKSSDVGSTKRPKQGAVATPNASEKRSILSSSDKQIASGNNKDVKPDPEIMESMKISGSTQDQGIMDLLTSSDASGELSWTSSDGQYAAVVDGQQITIYSVPPTGIGIDRLPLTSLPFTGQWVTGEWSADSLSFKYVTESNGKTVENVYVVPDSKTSTPLPKGTPDVTPTSSATNAPSSTTSTK